MQRNSYFHSYNPYFSSADPDDPSPSSFYSQASLYPRRFFPSPFTTFSVRQPFPPVDPTSFIHSANETQSLLRDAQQILTKIQRSRAFSTQLKEMAQQSEQAKVDQLVQSIGVQSRVKTSFTPDQIRFELRRPRQEEDCCILRMILSW